MDLSNSDRWLWLAGLIEHLLLLAVVWIYRRIALFPFFTAAMAGNVLKTIVLFFVYRHGSAYAYYYTYLCLAFADFFLQIGISYEIVLHIFRPAGQWSPGAKEAFRLTVAAALLISCALSWMAPATDFLSDTLLIRGNFMAATLMTEIFVGMLVLSVKRGLPWKTYVARIAQGFGAYCFLCVVVETLHAHFGLQNGTAIFRAISRFRIVFYQAVVLYWIVSLARSAPPERELPIDLWNDLVFLQGRTNSLRTLLASWRRV